MFLVCERWVGDGDRLLYIDLSSFDHSITSFAFWLAAQSWVLGALALRLELVLIPPASYLQLRLELSASNSNWIKPSVVPGYIIVWLPPASSARTHLHRIQPRPQVKVIFRHPRPDTPVSSAYLHRCISWLTAWSRVNMQRTSLSLLSSAITLQFLSFSIHYHYCHFHFLTISLSFSSLPLLSFSLHYSYSHFRFLTIVFIFTSLRLLPFSLS